MKLQRVYIDTSVIGGCFDKEFAVWSKSLIDDCRSGRFKAVVSEVVSVEINSAPKSVRLKYAELVGYGTEIIEVDTASLSLLAAYQRHDILSVRFRNDLLHIALATVAGVDL